MGASGDGPLGRPLYRIETDAAETKNPRVAGVFGIAREPSITCLPIFGSRRSSGVTRVQIGTSTMDDA
ncbi:hypothetical protein CKO23_07220 [Thiocystis violacea]|nr:hypothetical protein [Thiocystis violacea]